jgi:hypothetical protein
MLISMFNTLMRVEQNQSGRIKGTKVEIVELRDGAPVFGREKPGICDNKLLIVWIAVCVCCTFVAAIFISSIGVSFIDLYTTSKSESICTPVISKRRLYNQDEFENMYRFEGPYILKCEENA